MGPARGHPALPDRLGEITSRLPGERALQQEFGLAPVTIRKAVHRLRDEGWSAPRLAGHLRGEEPRQYKYLAGQRPALTTGPALTTSSVRSTMRSAIQSVMRAV